ncbi:hypothetical protein COY52_11300 [Candidatus Desantisbacteria bacterium CG_4_10_14_0_8_um_filter_48_22]|uniref:Uncharacterized protein n=1 Tax=Candidatus Desantisbacteria bacterium CG_4_10_14_0_8_um_filter_48_22 TaxID=1974543 RepID=A0A2M7S5N0_9BACT|nr:MAG: hypothetical protein AUJ67_08775 [Candidatus Desantisbacteria bacterium CG1_02_49_89]PIZ14698.1 MAG: hypothetical protein COY52_11300 [Candidatus Desantisbacteria bacterium CG_4_10_14_0_8_um_filter_48_22]
MICSLVYIIQLRHLNMKPPPIPLKVGVLRFEDRRNENDCSVIFSVPFNKEFTKALVNQFTQSNVFEEVKEVPFNLLQQFENSSVNDTISRAIADELKVNVLLCGKIEKWRFDTIRKGVFLLEYTVESIFKLLLIDINTSSIIWVDKCSLKTKEEIVANPISFEEKKILKRLIAKMMKEVNEEIQKMMIFDLTSENTKDYSSNYFTPKIVLKGSINEENVFLKAKKDEIRKEGISLAQTTIVIEAIPAAAIFGFTWYWAYPLIAVPSWFIASNMGESNAKKIVEQKKRVFFEKDQ